MDSQVSDFLPDGRQIFWIGGFKKLGSSTQIFISFSILLLFFRQFPERGYFP